MPPTCGRADGRSFGTTRAAVWHGAVDEQRRDGPRRHRQTVRVGRFAAIAPDVVGEGHRDLRRPVTVVMVARRAAADRAAGRSPRVRACCARVTSAKWCCISATRSGLAGRTSCGSTGKRPVSSRTALPDRRPPAPTPTGNGQPVGARRRSSTERRVFVLEERARLRCLR